MKIYIVHSREFDYVKELYQPIKSEPLFANNEIILPHDNDKYQHDRSFYKDIDLVIAEVSYPSIGLGIELGFLYDDNKPIYCMHKTDKKVSGSINVITNNIYEYSNIEEMLRIIQEIIDRNK